MTPSQSWATLTLAIALVIVAYLILQGIIGFIDGLLSARRTYRANVERHRLRAMRAVRHTIERIVREESDRYWLTEDEDWDLQNEIFFLRQMRNACR